MGYLEEIEERRMANDRVFERTRYHPAGALIATAARGDSRVSLHPPSSLFYFFTTFFFFDVIRYV